MNTPSIHKIRKLCNAIKEMRGYYEGAYRPDVKPSEWVQPPKPQRRPDVIRWLQAIHRTPQQIEADLVAIDSFKTKADFEAWLKKLEEGK